MCKRVLVIGSGWEQYALIEEIKKGGHTIIATNPVGNAEGFRLADYSYVKDSRDIVGHLTLAETHNIDAVITDNCDFSLYTATVLASKLDLPFASMKSAIFSNDKLEQRKRCEEYNIVQPRFQGVRDLDQARVASEKIGFPQIIKPVDSRGTFGVTIIQNSKELEDAFYNALDQSNSRIVICEEFIVGTLITVDGFCFKNGHKSLATASRKFEDGPKPVTKEIIYPAQYPDNIVTNLLENHEKVVEALGYNFGHTHGEYIINDNHEIFLVECTNRGGGVYTSSTIVPKLTEINLNRILMNQSLGCDDFEAPELGIQFMKKSIILTFLDYQEGRVIRDINEQEVKDLKYTVKFRSLFQNRDMVEPVENCASRHSMLVIEGEDATDSLANLESFKNTLNIQYY